MAKVELARKMTQQSVERSREQIDSAFGYLARLGDEERSLRDTLNGNLAKQRQVREDIARLMVEEGAWECLRVDWTKVRKVFGIARSAGG